MHGSRIRRSANISATSHDCVLMLRWHLPQLAPRPILEVEDPTCFTTSPLLRSTTSMFSCCPATIISAVPFDVKLIHRKSFISLCLARVSRAFPRGYLRIVPDMPYWWTPSQCHVNIFTPQHHNALIVDQNLTDRSIVGRVRPEGSVPLKLGAVERGNATLQPCQSSPEKSQSRNCIIHNRFQSREALGWYRRSS